MMDDYSYYKDFFGGDGQEGSANKRQKDYDNKGTIEYSDRLDSTEEQEKYVEKKTQPVQEKPTKPKDKKTEVRKNPDYTYYFSLVLDTTADVALYYDRIYAMLIRVVEKLEATKDRRSSNSRKINMKIGITTFHDEVTGDDDKLGKDFFTDDFDAVRERLRNMKFWGGNCKDGRECINDAQFTGLKRMALQRDSDGENELGASCSQILITTSLPPVTPGNKSGFVSFREVKEDDDFTKSLKLGVRFALNIVLDKNQYSPVFRIVDRDGSFSQEKSHPAKVENIEDILNGIVKGQNHDKPFKNKDDVVAAILNDLLERTSLLSIQT